MASGSPRPPLVPCRHAVIAAHADSSARAESCSASAVGVSSRRHTCSTSDRTFRSRSNTPAAIVVYLAPAATASATMDLLVAAESGRYFPLWYCSASASTRLARFDPYADMT